MSTSDQVAREEGDAQRIQKLAREAADRWWASNPDSLTKLPAGKDLWLLSVAVKSGENISSSCLGFHSKDLPQEAMTEGRRVIDAAARQRGMDPQLFCAGVLSETTKRQMPEAGELPLLAGICLLPDEMLDVLRRPLAEKEFQVLQFVVDGQGVQFSVGPFRKFDD